VGTFDTTRGVGPTPWGLARFTRRHPRGVLCANALIHPSQLSQIPTLLYETTRRTIAKIGNISSRKLTETMVKNISNPSLYQSIPLAANSKCIRVLDVHPPQGPEGDKEQIKTKLQVLNLDSERCPRFSALTYVWRPKNMGDKLHQITCGDFTVHVLPNCHSALWHLRKKLGKFTVWIDAICINQGDTKEKEHQIPMIGDIYSRAEVVYVWLRESSEQIDRAMAYLDEPKFLKYFSTGDSVERNCPQSRAWAAAWSYCFTRCSSVIKIFSSASHGNILRTLIDVILRRAFNNGISRCHSPWEISPT